MGRDSVPGPFSAQEHTAMSRTCYCGATVGSLATSCPKCGTTFIGATVLAVLACVGVVLFVLLTCF